MTALVRRLTLFALYQLSIVAGIVLLPLALVARQAGVPVPLNRVLQRLQGAYDRAAE